MRATNEFQLYLALQISIPGYTYRIVEYTRLNAHDIETEYFHGWQSLTSRSLPLVPTGSP